MGTINPPQLRLVRGSEWRKPLLYIDLQYHMYRRPAASTRTAVEFHVQQ